MEQIWYNKSNIYHIYPLGFCGAPLENDGQTHSRIEKVAGWIPHLQAMGMDAVYFGPVFESDRHGYDTRDYRKIDCRLGTNSDFEEVCRQLHGAGIRILLDGVFNHVGRGFWAFQDVLHNRERSPYLHWFHISLDGDSPYGDGLWYEGWEGHFDLVKLNLKNPEVVDYLLESVDAWINQFQVDGLRLDVAYMLDRDFLRRLRQRVKGRREDFFLLGEIIHGDYNQIVNGDMLDSCTNYECYKGLYSSFNDQNLYEIAYSLNRQFGPEQWTLYKGKHLVTFADNHDVNRVASVIKDQRQLPLLYGLLFGIPGIPCIYYGSEWGLQGEKGNGDDSPLRPSLDRPVQNGLSQHIVRLAHLRSQHPALHSGSYRQIQLDNTSLVFERSCEEETLYIAVNTKEEAKTLEGQSWHGQAKELITNQVVNLNGSVTLPGVSVTYWEIKR